MIFLVRCGTVHLSINWFRADRQFHISNSILALSAHNFNPLHARAHFHTPIYNRNIHIGYSVFGFSVLHKYISPRFYGGEGRR